MIGVAHDGARAVDLVAELNPDLVLMDPRMPIMNGIRPPGEIHRTYPAVKVLILTTYDDDVWVFDAIEPAQPGVCSRRIRLGSN
ncbi:response regulator transcription factor [Candidatus Amarolinea dominans]|uniref:response regulator n=1 Tax=Candidatus Amarolinea dominans TaxID=3140696 RepID=UPI001D762A96|nr:response regulator transcription factor [Anaerolineae bacterium]